MQTPPEFGLKDLLSHIVGGITGAVSGRNGETQQQRFVRTQAAAFSVMTFHPTDAVEAMISGHCVMFHELIVDSVQHTLRGEDETSRRPNRAAIVAMDKAFGNNLTRLERYRKQLAEGDRAVADAKPDHPRSELDIADRVRRHAAYVDREQAAPIASSRSSDVPNQVEPVRATTGAGFPSPEAIAACQANPDAMAALDAGDPVRFARAIGVKQPSEAFVAAAIKRPDIFGRSATK